MTVAFRRGACPALSAPMQTGDGLLVRLALTGEALLPAQLTALCAAATHHGNGMVEITARGNFQIRGLTAQSAPRLADEIAAMNLSLRDGVPVETGPLAGLDPDETADPGPLAKAIRAAIDATDLATRLGPKVSVVVDGGGRFDMAEIAADMRLTAVKSNDDIQWQIAIGGDAATATKLGFVTGVVDAESATLSLLETIALHGPTARARDLLEADASDAPTLHSMTPPSVLPDISPTRREIGRDDAHRHPSASQRARQPGDMLISPPVGEMSGRTEGGNRESNRSTDHIIFSLTDGRFATAVALPFGSIHADELSAFAENAAALEATDIRFAPARRLVLLCASETAAIRIKAAAREAGFIVDENDPRTHIFACPGSPACASGNIPARAIATVIAAEWADRIDKSQNLHISGCAKGCAHPAPSPITLVGNGNRTALVIDGCARNNAAASVPTTALEPALARLADAMQTDRNDKQRLAAAFAGD